MLSPEHETQEKGPLNACGTRQAQTQVQHQAEEEELGCVLWVLGRDLGGLSQVGGSLRGSTHSSVGPGGAGG